LANPEVNIGWRTVAFGHRDSYALNLLGQILSTRTGRLYKGLVLGRQVATEAAAGAGSRKWDGTFEISAEARDPHSPEAVERAIYEEMDRLKDSGRARAGAAKGEEQFRGLRVPPARFQHVHPHAAHPE